MQPSNLLINELMARFKTGQLTDQEAEQLHVLLGREASWEAVSGMIDEDFREGAAAGLSNRAMLDQIYQRIQVSKRRNTPVRRLRTWGWAAAAAVLLLLAGAYFLRDGTEVPTTAALSIPAIAPGKAGAILTLDDGSEIVLDSLGNGVIANQNGAQVSIRNGMLAYDVSGRTSGKEVYNTVTTPKGRLFTLTLHDGTKVWLNAASSIRYPAAFTGNKRKVEVKGEAYFEVAANAAMPFYVSANGTAEIEVLGTSFNVDAYDDEKITLLEGSIKVNTVLLKPGQQAQVNDGVKVQDRVNLDQVMAWKNGLFNFEGASLEEVMKQLERWYDIEVVYEEGIPDIEFVGEMTKNIPLNDLLVILEKSKVHFRMEGSRKLVVTK